MQTGEIHGRNLSLKNADILSNSYNFIVQISLTIEPYPNDEFKDCPGSYTCHSICYCQTDFTGNSTYNSEIAN